MEKNLFDQLAGKEEIEKRRRNNPEERKQLIEQTIGDEEDAEVVKKDDFFQKQENEIEEKNARDRKNLKSQISTELANKTKEKNYFGTQEQSEIDLVRKWISDIIHNSETELPYRIQEEIIEEMVLEVTGYGKIHELMQDPSISEVMINSAEEVWIERKGRLILTDIKFNDEEEVFNLATKIANNVGRSVTLTSPIVDARLPDQSRVHIVIPPIALKGNTITIRKFSKSKLTIDDLIGFGSITPEAAKFLNDAVEARANIVVSGGTGSGKTTTLNIVSNFVPDHERIVTIEDSAELQLNNAHVVRMEARTANAEGKGSVTIRDLVKASLRMRPERIIIGEIRDGAAFDLLNAMNTGHDGSMCTVHSNDPDACITRLENLVLTAGTDMPSRSIKVNITNAVDIIVQISRLPDGSRKITHISEVVEYVEATNMVITKPIYLFKKTGKTEDNKIIGKFEFTGHIATQGLQDKFELHGINYFESVGLEKPEENFN